MKIAVSGVTVALTSLLFIAVGYAESGLRPANAPSNQQCVEYYTQPDGSIFCSEQALQKTTVSPNDLKYERLSLRFDGRPWQAGFWNQQPQSPVWEYVVNGESVKNWNELVSTHFFPGLQTKATAEQFMQLNISQFRQQGLNPTINIIRQSPQDVLYEWTLTNAGTENQDELQRIFTTNEGIYMVRYTSRPTMSVKNRLIWTKLLLETTPKAKASAKIN